MMKLIQNGNVQAPAPLGKQDILIGGDKILAMAETIDPSGLPGEVEIIDASGMTIVPGFIDGHQHFTGGGGEGGFQTRTPEMTLSMNTKAGVTTAIGLLGTDSLTRSVEALFAKTEAFKNEGITTFMLTGSYWYPSPNITGDAAHDLVYLPPVIGVKLALADIRGPHMDIDKLATLASDIRVAALVAGKPGFITVHTGIKPERLDIVVEAVKELGVRADMFVPTHINRKDTDLKDQVWWLAENGGFVDATAHFCEAPNSAVWVNAADFAMEAREKGLFDQLMISSDAGGSMPKWNADHSRIIGMDVAKPDSLLFELRRMVDHFGLPLEEALKPLTINPARMYGLEGIKGLLAEGADGDLIIMEPETLAIRDVVARGKVMIKDGEVVSPGYFE
ncbi:beta-aspartyl-peptidase [Pseudodesulfovibrio sp. zrk46]|uniref:beta-aspartyl-peptidase n=1 Tax=Pseudodesulfovibrio sp. zrk46 TaxID=2725288 RepID=UPI0014491CCD|nr:beta-aspartyl-peptidase [Pseudodesulfovibrio sp. zrk46]QJB56747.1 beta-aspartyl-peptidase [Pseudodesulfovibrio sp. zrk46]